MQRHYSSIGDVINIRILDEYVSSAGLGFAIIELSDGRIGEAFILKRFDGIPFYVIADSDELYARTCTYLRNVQLKDRFEPDMMVRLHPKILLSIKSCSFLGSSGFPFCQIQNDERISDEEPPEQDSSSNILNSLNDYCLQEIFERLPIEDLCSVADTCKQFRKNAKRIATTRFDNYTPQADDLYRFESLLRNFGTNIKSLSICNDDNPLRGNSFFLVLAKYCSSANCQLETLSISDIHIQMDSFDILQPIFVRLQGLQLSHTNFEETVDKMNESRLMKILNIRSAQISRCNIYKILSKFSNLVQLELISYIHCPDENVTADEMMASLVKMNNLKKLRIDRSLAYEYSSKNILDLLADADVKIEWLDIDDYELIYLEDFLKRLKYLKVLQWSTYLGEDMTKLSDLIVNLPNLSEIHLENHLLNTTAIKNLAKCDELSVLRLGSRYDCERFHSIMDDDFDEMCGSVVKRKSKKKFTIQIPLLEKNCLRVAQDKVDAYRELLEIQIL